MDSLGKIHNTPFNTEIPETERGSFAAEAKVDQCARTALSQTGSIAQPLRPTLKDNTEAEISFARVTRDLPNLNECLEKGNGFVSLNELELSQIKERYNTQPDQLAYDALLAYKSGKISKAQFSTYLALYSVLKEFKAEEVGSNRLIR